MLLMINISISLSFSVTAIMLIMISTVTSTSDLEKAIVKALDFCYIQQSDKNYLRRVAAANLVDERGVAKTMRPGIGGPFGMTEDFLKLVKDCCKGNGCDNLSDRIGRKVEDLRLDDFDDVYIAATVMTVYISRFSYKIPSSFEGQADHWHKDHPLSNRNNFLFQAGILTKYIDCTEIPLDITVVYDISVLPHDHEGNTITRNKLLDMFGYIVEGATYTLYTNSDFINKIFDHLTSPSEIRKKIMTVKNRCSTNHLGKNLCDLISDGSFNVQKGNNVKRIVLLFLYKHVFLTWKMEVSTKNLKQMGYEVYMEMSDGFSLDYGSKWPSSPRCTHWAKGNATSDSRFWFHSIVSSHCAGASPKAFLIKYGTYKGWTDIPVHSTTLCAAASTPSSSVMLILSMLTLTLL